MKADSLRRLAGRVAAAVTEMNQAQRRMFELRMTMDRYLLEPDEAPDNYDEFLARSAGHWLREPSARERARR
jgi:hypothetical protein